MDINENGTFDFPVPKEEKKRLAQDDEIFNRARMVNCGFFLQIILGGTSNVCLTYPCLISYLSKIMWVQFWGWFVMGPIGVLTLSW